MRCQKLKVLLSVSVFMLFSLLQAFASDGLYNQESTLLVLPKLSTNLTQNWTLQRSPLSNPKSNELFLNNTLENSLPIYQVSETVTTLPKVNSELSKSSSQSVSDLQTQGQTLFQTLRQQQRTLALQVETLTEQLKTSNEYSMNLLTQLDSANQAYKDCVKYIEDLGIQLKEAEANSLYIEEDLERLRAIYQQALDDINAATIEKDLLSKKYASLERQLKISSIATPICLVTSTVVSTVGGVLIGVGVSSDNSAVLTAGISVTIVGCVGIPLIWSGGHWIFKFW